MSGFKVKKFRIVLDKMNKIFEGLYILVLDLLFPKKCINCGCPGDWVCESCIKEIKFVSTDTCFFCGRISEDSKICKKCHKYVAIDAIFSSVLYDSKVIKELVHNLKYVGIQGISELLGEFLVQRVGRSKISIKDFVVVPVPSHPKRQKQRGYNQAELIARYFCKRIDLSGGLALEKIVETKPQVSFGREQRMQNIAGSIACCDQKLILGKKVLLVDDISTTGATLSECAKVLKIAGAKEVRALVVAHA